MASKNLKQLDVQNLYLLNMPSKLLLAGLLIVGMLALGYVGVFKDQIETLNTQEAKEAELKETFTRKSIQAASLNNLKAELASIRSAFDVLLKQLPTDAEIPNLIQELHQAGSTNGLRLASHRSNLKTMVRFKNCRIRFPSQANTHRSANLPVM